MPDDTLKLLSAHLWDLRAQCERKLRALTEAQRLVDEYAMEPESGPTVKRRLVLSLDQVVTLDGEALKCARQCRSVAAILPG